MAKIEVVTMVDAALELRAKYLKQASEITGEDSWWCLYGPSGHGKTIAAASAAQNFPATLPAKSMTRLEGIIYWQADRAGVDSLHALNMDAPVIDLSKYTTVSQIRTALNAAAEITKHLGCHTVIIDTLSSLDNAILADLTPKFIKDGNSKFGLYQALLAEHNETLKTVRGLACKVLFLCHSKAKNKFGDGDFKEAAEAKEAATETPGDFTVSMDLSGKTLTIVRSQCSLIIPVIAEKIGNRDPDYALYPNGYPGFEYKNRYRCFANKERPNLFAMMQKVKAHKEVA